MVMNEEFLSEFQERQMSFQPDFILEFAHYIGEYYNNNGYFVDLTSGGNCGEGFIRISKGKKNYYYPNYFRNGQIRSNAYVLDVANIRHDNEQDAEIVYN